MKRSQPSGSQNRKRNAKIQKLEKSMAGSLDIFVVRSDKPHELLDASGTKELMDEDLGEELNQQVLMNEELMNQFDSEEAMNDCDKEQPTQQEDLVTGDKESKNIDDPAHWDNINQSLIDSLVRKGPKRSVISKFPLNKEGRHFSHLHYTRRLQNREKMNRVWLQYSVEVDKVFCFCCKLFKKGERNIQFANDGSDDWHNIVSKIERHETSNDHLWCMSKWVELAYRLNSAQTIDKGLQLQLNREREHWRSVMLRILAVVKRLARNNLAFRGSNEKIYEESNGNFLGFIETIAEFDPTMEEHIRRFKEHKVKNHYLSHKIQNELIQDLAGEVRSTIVRKVKEEKYFSIILDCTPDVSHEEQMSVILRCVDVSASHVKIEEFFLGFVVVEETTGLGLFNKLQEVLSKIQLDIGDLRGQGYDNGSNMKGKHKGVQSRVLEINPRAFYTPCGCHSLNLAICDMTHSCKKAIPFFGVLQHIYNIFASSTKRWAIFHKHTKGNLTVKALSTTRWESRLKCVKAIIKSTPEIREALLELADTESEPVTKSSAESLANNELGNFEFLFAMIIWYNLLGAVNVVSKILQNKDMQLDIAIRHLKGLIDQFEEYRENEFDKWMIEAKVVATTMEIAPTFCDKRVRRRKKQSDEIYDNASEELTRSPEEQFKFDYFLPVLDASLRSLKDRFEQFEKYEKYFMFLFDVKVLKSTDRDSLETYCKQLAIFLTNGDHSDIDGEDLFQELLALRRVLPEETKKAIDVLDYLKRTNVGESAFPNAWVAYRILLTIPITVASAERSFSKLKLIKSYLRSTMSQERLNGLAMLSIESKLTSKVNYDSVVTTFATRHASRSIFQ